MFLINGILITHCTLWLTYNIHMTLVISNQKFGHAWAHIPKMIVLIWRNIWCLSSGKKSTSSFPFRLRYCIDIANLLFWVLGYAWLHTLKVILSTWRKFLYIAKIMQTSYFEYFGHAWLPTLKLIASAKMIP